MLMFDTHIAVALFEGRVNGLSTKAKRAIDREPAAISPAVLLELELLHEIGRLRQGAKAIARHLDSVLAVHLAGESFVKVAKVALDYRFTRDPFDRLILAHAALLDAQLVTLDGEMQRYYAKVLH